MIINLNFKNIIGGVHKGHDTTILYPSANIVNELPLMNTLKGNVNAFCNTQTRLNE